MHRIRGIGWLFGLGAALLLAACGGGGGSGGTSSGGVSPPIGTTGAAYPAFAFSASGGSGTYTWSATGTLPPGVSLDSSGLLTGVPTLAGTFVAFVTATDSANPGLIASATVSIQISDSMMVLSSDAPPAGTLTYPYGFGFSVLSGGSEPFAWTLSAGKLPPGLALDGGGSLTGTPTSAGSFGFTVTVVDSAQPAQTVAVNATIVVSAPGPLLVDTTQAPPPGTNGAQYAGFGFVANGGYLPRTWSFTAGTLPPGLTLGPDGSLSGSPTAAGTFTFTVTVTDSAATPASNSAAFTVLVSNPPPPTINLHSPPTATVGSAYAGFQFTAADGLAPLVWSESGALAGLVFGLDGTLSGTPTAAGKYPITVGVTDALSRAAPATPFTVRVSQARPDAGFTATGSLATARVGHTATLLADGKVLVAGGQGTASAELYDAASGSFAATGGMAAARSGHTATLLASGKALIVGGGPATAELYDPGSASFTATGDPLVTRQGQTATRLANGKVLLAGGGTDTAELYDPASGAFAATGSMSAARTGHFAAPLADGRVLIVGGGPASAELYDPATGSFSATSGTPAVYAVQSATPMADGRVLVTGATVVAQLFDPATGLFAPVGDLLRATRAPTATLLNDGTVLLAGGAVIARYVGIVSVNVAARFAPESEGFTATGSLVTPRSGHTATLLTDGSVLVVGGARHPSVTALSSAELYK